MSDRFLDIETNYSEYLPKNKDANILDFGCGEGRISKFLIGKGYHGITATDIDQSLIENINNTLDINAISIDEFEREKPELEGRFDLIIAKDVIYYLSLPDIQILLDSFRNMLKPNGVLLIEIFNGATLTGPFVMYKDLGIIHVFTEHSLIQLLKNSNYKIESIRGNIFPIKGLKSFIYSIIQILWRFIFRTVFFLERGLDPQNPKILNRKIIVTAKAK